MAVLKESAVQGSTLREDYFTAPAADFEDAVIAEFPEPVAKSLTRVRDLGTHDRIARLIDDLVSDGLATRNSGVLSLPQ